MVAAAFKAACNICGDLIEKPCRNSHKTSGAKEKHAFWQSQTPRGSEIGAFQRGCVVDERIEGRDPRRVKDH